MPVGKGFLRSEVKVQGRWNPVYEMFMNLVCCNMLSDTVLISWWISWSVVLELSVRYCYRRLLDNVDECLQEFYGDFIAVSPHLMSLNVIGCCDVSSLYS